MAIVTPTDVMRRAERGLYPITEARLTRGVDAAIRGQPDVGPKVLDGSTERARRADLVGCDEATKNQADAKTVRCHDHLSTHFVALFVVEPSFHTAQRQLDLGRAGKLAPRCRITAGRAVVLA